MFNLEPVVGAGAGQVKIGGIAENNGIAAEASQVDDIFRSIVNIYMGSYGAFVFHKAKIPVGDVVVVKPVNGLDNGGTMKKLEE